MKIVTFALGASLWLIAIGLLLRTVWLLRRGPASEAFATANTAFCCAVAALLLLVVLR